MRSKAKREKPKRVAKEQKKSKLQKTGKSIEISRKEAWKQQLFKGNVNFQSTKYEKLKM